MVSTIEARADSARTHPNPSLNREGLDRANLARGEATIRVRGQMLVLRPSFSALVAAEGELGPLFALVERAASGALALGEMATLFWHCLAERPKDLTREGLGEGLAEAGLANMTPALRTLLQQILQGR